MNLLGASALLNGSLAKLQGAAIHRGKIERGKGIFVPVPHFFIWFLALKSISVGSGMFLVSIFPFIFSKSAMNCFTINSTCLFWLLDWRFAISCNFLCVSSSNLKLKVPMLIPPFVYYTLLFGVKLVPLKC